MTGALSTGWADVEASILADSAAGLSIPKIADRCGWGRQAVAGVLARHGMPVYSAGGSFVRGKHTKVPSTYVPWTDEEKAVILAATSYTDAHRAYHDAFPHSKRGQHAARSMYYDLRRRKA
jgi:hypothetical protein